MAPDAPVAAGDPGGGAFVPCRLYEGLWRSPGMWDLRTMVAGVFSSTLGFVLVVSWAFGLTGSPRSVMVLDAVFRTISS